MKKIKLKELNNSELKEIQGKFSPTFACAASLVALYEFGYQYGKRHLDNAK